MVKLDVEVDGGLPQVANAEGQYLITLRKSREIFVLSPNHPRILMEWSFINNMKIILRTLSLDGDLVSTVLLHGFMEALDLILGQVVVESDGCGGCEEND